MNRELIIKMARDTGATPYTNRHYPDRPTHTFNVEQLERFFQLATEWQQTKDAEICHRLLDPDCSDSYNLGIAAAGSAIIRGETK